MAGETPTPARYFHVAPPAVRVALVATVSAIVEKTAMNMAKHDFATFIRRFIKEADHLKISWVPRREGEWNTRSLPLFSTASVVPTGR